MSNTLRDALTEAARDGGYLSSEDLMMSDIDRLLAHPAMAAIARVVDEAVTWHEHKASIPSGAFLLDHAVTAMLGEPCSCGGRCELALEDKP